MRKSLSLRILSSVRGIVVVMAMLPGLLIVAPLAAEESRIVEGSTVTIDFTVTTLPDKKVVTTTDGKEPLSYVQGQGQIVPGLEKALSGHKAGDRKKVELSPEQAYGAYDDKKRMTVARNRVPPDAKVGSVLQDKKGEPIRVVEMSDSSVILDRNHPLAGKIVMFDVKILNVVPPEGTR